MSGFAASGGPIFECDIEGQTEEATRNKHQNPPKKKWDIEKDSESQS